MPEQNRPEPIKIRELADEYRRNAERLKIRRHQIAPRHDLHNGERSVHPKVEQEVAEIDERLDEHRADRLLDAVWNHLDMPGKPPEAGVMPSQQGEPAEDLKVGELRCAAVYWMLRRSGHTDPEAPGFVAELNRRRTEFDGASERYKAVAKAELGKSRQLSIEAVDRICQRLIEEGKPANAETVEQAREAVSRKYEHRKRHEISLADLATDAEVEIVPDHSRRRRSSCRTPATTTPGCSMRSTRSSRTPTSAASRSARTRLSGSRTIGATARTGGCRRNASSRCATAFWDRRFRRSGGASWSLRTSSSDA